MNDNQHLSPEPIYDALHRACNMAREGNCTGEWRQLRIQAETLAAERARKAEASAKPAPITIGPARTEWSESEVLAKTARSLAVNIAEENRKWGVLPDTSVSAASA